MYKVEKAPSNNSTCVDCKNKVIAGEYRVVEVRQSGRFASKTTRCAKCGLDHMMKRLEDGAKQYEEIKAIINKA